MLKKTTAILTLSLAFTALVCIHTSNATEYPTLHRGVRPLGMGGAFTAVADDENALFYNPAGLAKISILNLGILNPLVEISENTIDMVKDAGNTDMDDTGEVTDFLREYVGKTQHARISLFPYVGFNIADVGVMVGGLAQSTLDVTVRNPTWPEVHTRIVTDTGLLAGGGLKLPYTGLSGGMALKLISRKSLEEVYTAADIADGIEFDDDMHSGSGISADIGVIYELPILEIVEPAAGITIQNFPSMNMGDAEELKSQVNLGLSVRKSIAFTELIGALDYHDLTNSLDEDEDIAKRIHIGVEVQLPMIASLRTGFNQGYFTFGTTLEFGLLRIDFATYGEEVGAYAGQRVDRRTVFQFSFGW